MSSRDAITIRHIAKLRRHWWVRDRIPEAIRLGCLAWLRRYANRMDGYDRAAKAHSGDMAKLGMRGRRRFR